MSIDQRDLRQRQLARMHDEAQAKQWMAERFPPKKENKDVSMHKTKFGSVKKFPDLRDRDSKIAEVRQALSDLWDKADAAEKREQGMQPSVDASRFPSVARGTR